MSTVLTAPVTADHLFDMPDDGNRYELVKGELRKAPPPGEEHGEITMNLAAPLHQHVKRHKLGVVCAAETGFKLESDPDTVRGADIAFIRAERAERTAHYLSGSPDLVVETLSPSDRTSEVEGKVAAWIAGGARLVWVVSPKLHNVTVYRSLTEIVTLTEKDTLDGGDVVPGFQIQVTDIFA